MYESIEVYDRLMKEHIHNKLPMNHNELKTLHS